MRLDPAQAVIDRDAEHADADKPLKKPISFWLKTIVEGGFGRPFRFHFQRFKMDDVDQRDIGDDRRNEGVLDDVG